MEINKHIIEDAIYQQLSILISNTKIYDSRAISVLNKHPYIIDKSLRDYIKDQIAELCLPKLLWKNLVQRIEL